MECEVFSKGCPPAFHMVHKHLQSCGNARTWVYTWTKDSCVYYWVIVYNIVMLKFVNWLLDESGLCWIFGFLFAHRSLSLIAVGWLPRNSNARSHEYMYLTLYNTTILLSKVSVHLTFPPAMDEKSKYPTSLFATCFSVFYFPLHKLMTWEQRNMNTLRNVVLVEVNMAVVFFTVTNPVHV